MFMRSSPVLLEPKIVAAAAFLKQLGMGASVRALSILTSKRRAAPHPGALQLHELQDALAGLDPAFILKQSEVFRAKGTLAQSCNDIPLKVEPLGESSVCNSAFSDQEPEDEAGTDNLAAQPISEPTLSPEADRLFFSDSLPKFLIRSSVTT